MTWKIDEISCKSYAFKNEYVIIDMVYKLSFHVP